MSLIFNFLKFTWGGIAARKSRAASSSGPFPVLSLGGFSGWIFGGAECGSRRAERGSFSPPLPLSPAVKAQSVSSPVDRAARLGAARRRIPVPGQPLRTSLLFIIMTVA